MISKEIYALLKESIQNREEVAFITITEHPQPAYLGAKVLLWSDQSFYSEITFSPKLIEKLIEQCLPYLQQRKSKTIHFTIENMSVECYVEIQQPASHLIIAGAGHVAEAIAPISKMLQFQVTVMDDRPEYANEERFGFADEIICCSFTEYFHKVELTPHTYILLLTRGHRYDVLSLQALLARKDKPAYIGMIGSRRRISGVFEQLKGEFSEDSFAQLYTPVGLDIGAESPAEIAISILAEILKVKNQRSGLPLSEQIRPLAQLGFREGKEKEVEIR